MATTLAVASVIAFVAAPRPKPPGATVVGADAVPRPPPERSAERIAHGALFAPSTQAPTVERVERCDHGLRLVGTVLIHDRPAAYALLDDGVHRELHALGTFVARHLLTTIATDHVVLESNEAVCTLPLTSTPQPSGAAATVDGRQEGPTVDDPVELIAPGTVRVDRDVLRQAANGQLPTRLRLVPGARGLRVYGLRADDALARAGVRNGDTVAAIDGRRPDDIDALLSLYGRLDQIGGVEVTLERLGERIPLSIRLR